MTAMKKLCFWPGCVRHDFSKFGVGRASGEEEGKINSNISTQIIRRK